MKWTSRIGLANKDSSNQSTDGDFGTNNGWAIAFGTAGFGSTNSETAVWETATDLSAGSLVFTMSFLHNNPGHLLGRFRLSVTTDDRNSFADGLDTNGDVNANWTVLTNPLETGPASMTFTTLGDSSILSGDLTADQGVYVVSFENTLQSVTGIRLEALEDPSLPGGNGPGLISKIATSH